MGFTMNRCKQCNVSIRDDATICPLCQCVLEKQSETDATYPNVHLVERKLKLFSNVCLFVMLLAAVVMVVCNFMIGGKWWCIIPIAAMAYAFILLRVLLFSRSGYRSKMFIPLLLGVLFVSLVDAVTGFHRWSVNYVLPSGVMMVDLLTVLLMIINKRNWQSYMILEIGMIVASFVPILLWIFGVITSPLLSFIALGVSVFLFLGTLIIGDYTARGELRRRFHIR